MTGQAEWYACVHVRELPAQALLRGAATGGRNSLRTRAVAVLEGKPPLQRVCGCTRAAAQAGIVTGMTREEAESFGMMELLVRSPAEEVRTRAVLLDSIAGITPRVEQAALGTETACAYVLDLTGTERLLGTPHRIAQQAIAAARGIGLSVEIGLAQNFHVAVALAQARRGVSMAEAGRERDCLARLPVTLLTEDPEQRETLAAWGIERMGELAELPEGELISRMGQPGRMLRLLARGEAPHLFQPIEAPFLLQEELELEEPLELLEPLLFCVSPMLGTVVAQAGERALAIAMLRVTAGLEGGGVYRREIRPALPTYDRALLLKLVHLDMAAHPPEAGVRRLEISAEAGPLSRVQLGLFAPQLPEPGRLDVTLARIKSIVGEDRVGWARAEDTHRDDSFRMERFVIASRRHGLEKNDLRCTAVRRLRPAVTVSVRLTGRAPAVFWYIGQIYRIDRTFGPWHRSGTWWSEEIWSVESWDVVAHTSAGDKLICVLGNDRLRGDWRLEAVYD